MLRDARGMFLGIAGGPSRVAMGWLDVGLKSSRLDVTSSCDAAAGVGMQMQSTPRGFEPLRAEPNGFLVHHLSHSVTVSHADGEVGSLPSLRTWPRQDMYVAALLVYKARLCVNQSASPAEQTMRSRVGVGGAHAAALARAGLEMTEAVPMMMMGRQQCRQSRRTVRHRVVLCIIT